MLRELDQLWLFNCSKTNQNYILIVNPICLKQGAKTSPNLLENF